MIPGGARYAVDGRVSAVEALRLIKEGLAAIGLAVPRMPMGSSGMELEADGRARNHMLRVNRDGAARVF